MRPEALAAAQWWADRLALGPGRHDMGDPRINAIMNRDVPEVPYTPEQLTAFRGVLAEGIDREIGAAYGRPITIRFDYQPDWVLSDAAQRAGIDLEPDGLPLLPVKTYTRVAPGLVSVAEGDTQYLGEPVVVWEADAAGPAKRREG
jgi:hypothetical protein